MEQQASIGEGLEQSSPHIHWGWQNEFWQAADAHDQVPGDNAKEDGDESEPACEGWFHDLFF